MVAIAAAEDAVSMALASLMERGLVLAELPSGQGRFRFRDTWEWDFRDYDWWFLWACEAILWGVGQYDAHHASAVAA